MRLFARVARALSYSSDARNGVSFREYGMARRRVGVWIGFGVLVLLAVAITATVGWRPIIGPAARPLTDRKFDPTPGEFCKWCDFLPFCDAGKASLGK